MVTVENEKNINRAVCSECGSTLLYNAEDRIIGPHGNYCITCPVCLNKITVHYGRHEKIIFPDTFRKFEKTGIEPEEKDEKIQEYINRLIKEYKGYRDKEKDFGGYMFYTIGNILVVLFEDKDEIIIHVAEDYYEDFIDKERIDDFY